MHSVLEKTKEKYSEFKKLPLLQKADVLSFLFLCLFVFDCSFAGGGRYLHIGPVTPRMVFIALTCIFALPKLLGNFKKYLLNPVNLLTLVFVIYMVISGVRGFMAGNRRNVLISDIKGFMWLFLVPVVIAVADRKDRFHTLLSWVMAGAFFQACFVLFLNAFCSVVYEGIAVFYNWMMDSQVGTVSSVSSSIFRVFMKSSPYMVLSCAVAVFRQIKRKKISAWYVAVIAVCCHALLLSFTRSLYGSTIVVFLCCIVAMIVLHRDRILFFGKFLLITLAAFCVLNYAQELAFGGNYLNFGISRTVSMAPVNSPVIHLRQMIVNHFRKPDSDASTDPSHPTQDPDDTENQELDEQNNYIEITEQSDAFRAQTQAELKQLIARNPVFGNGLGASAPCRPDGLDEYFYLDILARMGIVGLVLYVAPFGYIVFESLRRRKALAECFTCTGVLCGMVGFWAITWFNPWMNAVLGIACYAMCGTIPQLLKEKKN